MLQFSLRLLSFGNISGDFGGANDNPFLVFQGRDRQGNINLRSVLALANRLIVVNPLALTNSRKDLTLFVLPI